MLIAGSTFDVPLTFASLLVGVMGMACVRSSPGLSGESPAARGDGATASELAGGWVNRGLDLGCDVGYDRACRPPTQNA